MIAFVLVAVVMVASALAWILVPLLRRRKVPGLGRDASNVAILRDQLRELDADLAAGTLPREHYDEARRELEARVLEDTQSVGVAGGAPSQAAAWTAAILAASLPIAALILYVTLGNHDAFAPDAVRAAKGGAEHEVTREQVEGMAAKLAARLEKEPDNAEGWVMLARTYYALNRHADAVPAFEKAVALVPDDAALLADYADAVGAAQGSLNGKARELLDRALKIDPTQWKALALAGTAAFERKDYAQAIAYWEKLKAGAPPGSPIAGSIDASIAEARQMAGLAPLAPSAAGSVATGAAAGTSAQVTGTVSLAPALAAKASPGDIVFIFARAAEGPRMPLAILRKQVKDLPVAFTLDDSLAMAPNVALSKFASVIVGARVSKSGNATPQPGDLEGISSVVKVGTTGLAVVIDRALP